MGTGRRLAENLIGRLPQKNRRRILRWLLADQQFVSDFGPILAAELNPRLGLTRVEASGIYGPFLSGSNDHVIIAQYARDKVWAKNSNDLVARIFEGSNGGTYFDIGANIGLTTVPLAERACVEIHAFEPEPSNFENLSLNVKRRELLGKVHLHMAALSDISGHLSFEIAEGNLGDHRIAGLAVPGLEGEEKRKVIKVESLRLDDMAIEITHPFVVKIDTQGAEPLVISGGAKTLGAADLLLLEWSPYQMSRVGGDPEKILEFLQANFREAQMVESEAFAGPMSARPIEQVCATLRKTVSDWVSLNKKYVDVVAYKQQS